MINDDTVEYHLDFDGGILARGWLAAFLATGSDSEVAVLNRTLSIDVYPNGVRLGATDRYVVLTAWVGCSVDDAAEPLDATPLRTVVVHDPDGRGKQLLSYVAKVARKATKDDETPPGARLTFGLPASEALETFEGMGREEVEISLVDLESVRLGTIDGGYPNYRALLAAKVPKAIREIMVSPEILQKVGQVGQILDSKVTLRFAGAERMVQVVVDQTSAPFVAGGFMPVKPAKAKDSDDGERRQ